MPELVEPIVDLRGLTYLSQMAQIRNRMQSAYEKLALQKYADDQRYAQGEDRLRSQLQIADMRDQVSRDRLSLSVEREQRIADKASDAIKQAKDDTDRYINYQNDIRDIDADLGTKDWLQKYVDEVKPKYTDLTVESQGRNIDKDAISRWSKQREALFKGYNQRMAVNGLTDVIFSDPKSYQSADPDKDTMQFNLPTKQPNVFSAVKISKSKYDELKPMYQEFYGGGALPVPRTNEDKFIVGKKYKDSAGNTATYLGNGQWQ